MATPDTGRLGNVITAGDAAGDGLGKAVGSLQAGIGKVVSPRKRFVKIREPHVEALAVGLAGSTVPWLPTLDPNDR